VFPTGSDFDSKVRILIADGYPIFREGLKQVLSTQKDFEVLGEASDSMEALRLMELLKPDVLLLDMAMPPLNGMDVLARSDGNLRTTRVIILSISADSSQTVQALHLGACGILHKEVSSQVLLKSIRAVVQGQYWVGRRDMAGAIDALRSKPSLECENPPRNFGLTRREMQILQSLAEGLCNKEIARTFGISEQTVKHHVSSILNKTGMSNRLELVIFSINQGLNRKPRLRA
jgi:two-component system, NarL family, nitrate/nitrite response regulator NarL